MSKEKFSPELQNIAKRSPEPEAVANFPAPEEVLIPKTQAEEPNQTEKIKPKQEVSKPSFLESISTVSKEELSKSANFIASQAEKISDEDATRLLINIMKRFMVEQANEAVIINQGGTKLSKSFEEFQSAEDTKKQTERYMVEMLVDEWVRATGRRLVDPESSRVVSESIRTIREDMKVGWFKRMFRGKLSETEIIKSMEALQLELNETREQLNKAKIKEAEIADKSAQMIKKTEIKAQNIIDKARQEEERLRNIIAELKADPNVVKVYNEKFTVSETKAEAIEKFRRKIISGMELYYNNNDASHYFNKVLDSFTNLTIKEKNKSLHDLWNEFNGPSKVKKEPDGEWIGNGKLLGKCYFWRTFEKFLKTYKE